MREKKVLFLTRAALIAAVYVTLCVAFAPISYGEVQVRIAEALVILPYFTPAAIPGLFVGCILSNIMGGSILLDVTMGSLATLIGAVGSYCLRKNKVFLLLPPILSNALIIPFVLRYGYGVNLPIPLMMLSVGIGEVIAVAVLGTILLNVLIPYGNLLFGSAAGITKTE